MTKKDDDLYTYCYRDEQKRFMDYIDGLLERCRRGKTECVSRLVAFCSISMYYVNLYMVNLGPDISRKIMDAVEEQSRKDAKKEGDNIIPFHQVKQPEGKH